MRKHLRGRRAWSVLFAQIIGYEAAAPPGELLSEACDALIDKAPALGRITIWGAGLYLTAHLANGFTDAGLERYDILAYLPKLWQS